MEPVSFPSPEAERVWNTLGEIVETTRKRIEPRMNAGINVSKIARSVEILFEAVVLKYSIRLREYKLKHRLDDHSLKKLNLSTTQEMVSAKIRVWEDVIIERSHYSAMYDDYVTDQEFKTGFFPQPSVEEAFGRRFSEIQRIVNTTAREALELYNRISKNATVQSKRLLTLSLSRGVTRDKAFEINLAVRRLYEAILIKYGVEKTKEEILAFEIDKSKVPLIDLYSIDSMLDAKIYILVTQRALFSDISALLGTRPSGSVACISLRQALNISRLNPLNTLDLKMGPMWGQSRALERVVEQLRGSEQEEELQAF